MKEGLIRLTDEKDIFFDSIEKVYRYRIHCPVCGVLFPNCRCYQDLDRLLIDIEDGIADYTCSSKCALMGGEWDELDKAMQEAGIYKDSDELIKTLTDDRLRKYLKKEYGGCNIVLNLKNYPRERLLVLIEENDLKTGILEYYNISRSTQELTEEEAKKVMDILVENGDFDYPGGEDCI